MKRISPTLVGVPAGTALRWLLWSVLVVALGWALLYAMPKPLPAAVSTLCACQLIPAPDGYYVLIDRRGNVLGNWPPVLGTWSPPESPRP